MKVLSVFLIATFVALSHQHWNKPTNFTGILSAWKGKADPHMNTCMCRTGVKKDLLDGFFSRGETSEDPCFKCSVMCFLQQLNVMSTSGVVDVKMFQQQAAGVDGPIARKCGNIPGADMCQKSYDLLMCLLGIFSGRDPYPGIIVNKLNPLLQNIVNTKPWLPIQYL